MKKMSEMKISLVVLEHTKPEKIWKGRICSSANKIEMPYSDNVFNNTFRDFNTEYLSKQKNYGTIFSTWDEHLTRYKYVALLYYQ